jgi:rfaE bifunctional protein kinase chain/domain
LIFKMVAQKKIISLDDLAQKIDIAKKNSQKVIMCHGVFDLLHLGHMRHFEQAKEHGDVLIVTVTPDRYVNKGAHRPIFPEIMRAEAIAALSVVDHVAINSWPTAVETIRLLRPTAFCKGGEFRHIIGDLPAGLQAEVDVVQEVGSEIVYTDDNLLSSSNLINNYLNVFPPETQAWLEEFKEQHSVESITNCLENIGNLKVLVIGEAIIDEYVFCDGLGKSSKDPILAFNYCSTEAYAGGSLAVANHLAGFCSEVGLVTLLGEKDRSEEFVRGSLLPGVTPHFITQHGAPTIHKRRFVDNHTGSRLFELYMMDDTPLDESDEQALLNVIENQIDDYDLVVVVDYGHGMLTPATVQLLCDSKRFLCVNTQANAGNRGFNAISKYPKADYVCLAMHEVALETRLRHADWYTLVEEVINRIDCPRFTITWGKSGSLHYTHGKGFVEVPALATQVKDRVGAGDAVLAVTSALVAQDVPWEVVGFIGNLAGAQMVADLGNRVAVNKDSISRHAISLMK